MTAARVQIYDPMNTTYRGLLDTKGLTVSHEVGSAGSIEFTALGSAMDALDVWDSVARLQVWDGTAWVTTAAYAIRPPFTCAKYPADPTADALWQARGTGLLRKWASETRILPEYTVSTMPRGAGVERALGWPSSAYDPATDPNEAWDGCYETARTTLPTGFPTGSGATWISITGATDQSERKLFRATLDLTGYTEPQLIGCWASSDESMTLYAAGEIVLETSSVETGHEEFSIGLLAMWPGEYAIAVDTASDWSPGGDGIDPILVAFATVDDSGAPVDWLLVTNDTDWVACRRDDEPPGNEPPGPTPGAMLRYLVEEAQERSNSGWPSVTLEFTDTLDSYGDAWSTVVIERLVRYGSDSYWDVFNALAEAGEVEVWLSWDNKLYAAPRQGTTTTIDLDENTITTLAVTRGEDDGTWCAGQLRDGWVYAAGPGAYRREFAMEIGTALSRAPADRVVAQALAEGGRVDYRAKLLPVTGKVPLADYAPGDTVTLTYGALAVDVNVLTVSAQHGEAGLLWQAELVEVPS